MFGKVNKSAIVKWSIILSIILLLYFYNTLHSAIIFHSPNKYEYLKKMYVHIVENKTNYI